MPVIIEQLRYAVLGTRDLDQAARFAGEELGLQPTLRGEEEIAFRSDQRQYSLIYAKGDPARQAIGLEVHDEAVLQAATEDLAARGIAVQPEPALAARRNVRALGAFATPGGVRVELVVRPQHQGWRFFATRDTGISGLAAVALRSTDVTADEALWMEVFGLRVADRAGDAVYLGLDAAHHRLALHPAASAGVLAVEFEVEGLDQVMQQSYRLHEAGGQVMHGPGRRPTSEQLFLTFAGPDGALYAFVADGARVDPAAPPRPRQFAPGAASFCAWGSQCRIPELDASVAAPPLRPALRGVPR